MVSCGNSLCHDCILSLVNKELSGIICPVCNAFRKLPENSFSKNFALVELLQIQPKIISRGDKANILDSKLDQLNAKCKNFQYELKNSEQKIKDHCDFVRHDVDLATESAQEFIKKYRDDLFDKIKLYEVVRLNRCKFVCKCWWT